MKIIIENWRKYLVEEKPTSVELIAPKYIRDYGYVFGTTDGTIISQHNENKLFYGASNNKPFLALFNLINCSASKTPEQTPCKCLTNDELMALMSYDTKDEKGKRVKGLGHRGDSNIVNRALSRKISKTAPGYTKKRGKELCSPKDNEEATDFLAMLGFDTNMKVRHGGWQNKQSALGYFKLLSFLSNPAEYLKKLNPDLLKNQHFVNSADHILRYMKREFSSGLDHEYKGRFLRHLKDLRNMGLPIQSLYGKGGYFQSANNSAMIIDNKYIFVLFCKVPSKINAEPRDGGKKYSVMKEMSKMIADVLIGSGKYSKI